MRRTLGFVKGMAAATSRQRVDGVARLVVATALAWLAGCGSSSPALPADPRSAMAAVIAADRVAGAARDAATRTQPATAVVRGYAAQLRAMDLAGTPDGFAAAWLAHAQAWEELAAPLSLHPAERGEMHALFTRLREPARPGAADFTAALDRVWSTWAPIEALLAQHGVDG